MFPSAVWEESQQHILCSLSYCLTLAKREAEKQMEGERVCFVCRARHCMGHLALEALAAANTGMELLGKAPRGAGAPSTGSGMLLGGAVSFLWCHPQDPAVLSAQSRVLGSVPKAGVEELSICSVPALWSCRAPQETARACSGCSHSSWSYNSGLPWNSLSVAGHSTNSCELSCRSSLFPLRICKETQKKNVAIVLEIWQI